MAAGQKSMTVIMCEACWPGGAFFDTREEAQAHVDQYHGAKA
jgi:hypothetical protein